jgi:hypothetical protein
MAPWLRPIDPGTEKAEMFIVAFRLLEMGMEVGVIMRWVMGMLSVDGAPASVGDFLGGGG